MSVQTEIRQIAFQPPHPQANGRFVGTIFKTAVLTLGIDILTMTMVKLCS